MIRTTGTLRRATATLALAGAATFGAVALAPAASAAQPASPGPVVDGSADYLVDGKGNGGPVSFLVTQTGRKAIFFCEADKPNKRHNVCQADPETAPDRF